MTTADVKLATKQKIGTDLFFSCCDCCPAGWPGKADFAPPL